MKIKEILNLTSEKLEKYDQIRANIDKDLGIELRNKLKEEGKSIASWVTENAKKYLKKI